MSRARAFYYRLLDGLGSSERRASQAIFSKLMRTTTSRLVVRAAAAISREVPPTPDGTATSSLSPARHRRSCTGPSIAGTLRAGPKGCWAVEGAIKKKGHSRRVALSSQGGNALCRASGIRPRPDRSARRAGRDCRPQLCRSDDLDIH